MVEKLRHRGMRKERGEAQKALESAFATSFRVLKWAMYVVVIALLLTGVFRVKEGTKAVVLRFGRVRGVYEAGIHFALPYPIDEVRKIEVATAKRVELNKVFWHVEIEEGGSPLPLRPSLENGYTLTRDANIIHSRWRLRYGIRNAEKYLFEIRDAESFLKNVLNDAIVEASASYTVDEATKSNPEGLRGAVERLLRRNLKDAGHGETFSIQGVELDAIKPPLQTAAAFEEVVSAEQESGNKLNIANGERTSMLHEAGGAMALDLVAAIQEYRRLLKSEKPEEIKPEEILEARRNVDELLFKAGGTASEIISEARSYRERLVAEAKADAKHIEELIGWYKTNPGVLIAEKLAELYKDLFDDREVYLMTPTSAEGGRILRIILNRDPRIKVEERHKELLEEVK